MGHSIVLVPDYTLFIQLGLFLALYLVLRVFTFGPFRALQLEREAKTTGQADANVQAQAKVEALKKSYEEALILERKKAHDWLETERRKVSEEVKVKVQAAREKASDQLDALDAELKKESDQVLKELMPKAEDFSDFISKKMLAASVVGKTRSQAKAVIGELEG